MPAYPTATNASLIDAVVDVLLFVNFYWKGNKLEEENKYNSNKKMQNCTQSYISYIFNKRTDIKKYKKNKRSQLIAEQQAVLKSKCRLL